MSKTDYNVDGDLVRAFQSGDKQAMVMLVKRWHKTFCEKACWVVKDADTAKDIAQESWQVIIKKIQDLKNPNKFGGWALRIVYNKAIDVVNRNNRQLKAYNEIKQQNLSVAIEDSDNSRLKEALLLAINKLVSHQQRVLRLFYVEGYSLKDISDLEQISVGTAKSRLFHAREKLKQILKNKYYEN